MGRSEPNSSTGCGGAHCNQRGARGSPAQGLWCYWNHRLQDSLPSTLSGRDAVSLRRNRKTAHPQMCTRGTVRQTRRTMCRTSCWT